MSKHNFGRRHLHPGRWALIFLTAAGLLAASEACPDVLDGLVVVSAGADMYTTEAALRSPRLQELNPLGQSAAARVGLKTLGCVGVLAASKHLERHGHKRAGKVTKIVIIALWSGAAVNNHIQARRAK